LFLKKNRAILIILLFFLVGQLLFSAAPFVNLEYIYAVAGERIADSPLTFNFSELNFYVLTVGNPIMTSLIVSFWILLFGFSEFISRLPIIIIGAAFILLFHIAVERLFSGRIAVFASVILAFNPLFWNYSGMVYSEIPFIFFVFIALWFVHQGLKGKRFLQFFVSAIFLCLSFLTKYIGALFFVFIFFFISFFMLKRLKERSKVSRSSMSLEQFISLTKKVARVYWPFVVLFVLLCGGYVLWMYHDLGFFFSSEHKSFVFWGIQDFFGNYLIAFAGYLMWLAVFCGLIGFFSFLGMIRLFKNKSYFYVLMGGLFLVDLAFFSYVYKPLGEMDFGFLESVVPPWFMLFFRFCLLFLGELIFLDVVFVAFSGRNKILIHDLLRWFFIFTLLAISIARPTQRYLLLVLPVAVLYCGLLVRIKDRFAVLRLSAFLLTLMVFISMSLFISLYRYNLGLASADVVEYINVHNISSGIEFEPKSHTYYLLQDQTLYPFENPYLALGNYSRPYFTGPTSMIDLSRYDVIYSSPVDICGITIKELSVARKRQ